MAVAIEPACDTRPHWFCLLVTAAPVVVGLVVAWCWPTAPRLNAVDAGTTAAVLQTTDPHPTRR